MNKLNVALASVLLLAFASSLRAETYKVDGAHSFITFKVEHLGVSHAWGRFNNPTGIIAIDEQDPAKSKIEVQVPAANVDTGNQKRDTHLKSADFFNVKQFPSISFKSNSVKKTSENQLEVSGDLTLHGVTKPITVTLMRIGAADTQMGSRAGYEATFNIKRSDHGMTFMIGGVGDDVTLYVNLEGVKS